jgi:hypothetical protein
MRRVSSSAVLPVLKGIANFVCVSPRRGRGRKPRQPTGDNWLDRAPAERHASMTWMQRLKRVFNWAASGSILRPASAVRGRSRSLHALKSECRTTGLIERILAHLNGKAPLIGKAMLPEDRAPPQERLGAPDFSTDCMKRSSSALLLPLRKRRAYYWLEGRNRAEIKGKQGGKQRISG